MKSLNQHILDNGRGALDELWESIKQFDDTELQTVLQAISSANRIVLHGVGAAIRPYTQKSGPHTHHYGTDNGKRPSQERVAFNITYGVSL